MKDCHSIKICWTMSTMLSIQAVNWRSIICKTRDPNPQAPPLCCYNAVNCSCSLRVRFRGATADEAAKIKLGTNVTKIFRSLRDFGQRSQGSRGRQHVDVETINLSYSFIVLRWDVTSIVGTSFVRTSLVWILRNSNRGPSLRAPTRGRGMHRAPIMAIADVPGSDLAQDGQGIHVGEVLSQDDVYPDVVYSELLVIGYRQICKVNS